MSSEENLSRTHEEILGFLLNENRIAWELVSIYLVLQAALASAIVISLPDIDSGSPAYWILSLIGTTSSILWFFMMLRSKMRRKNWVLAGLRIEKELRERNIVFDVFETEYRVSEEGLVLMLNKKGCRLDLLKDEIRFHPQAWCERIGALRLAHSIMAVLIPLWFVLFLYLLFRWALLIHP